MIPQQTYDPDRIKVPLKRTNPMKERGVDPKWVPITWDEALDSVADKMIELRKANEPHKLVYMRGRYSPTSTHLRYGTLPKIFGMPNYFSHSAICAEAEKMGPGLTQGFFGYRDYDLEKTQCLVMWGCDPLASNRQVPNTIHSFGEILAHGTVIAVDPRLSNVAAKAHEWLPVLPGTDGALARAIAHLLLTEGLWSREFVGDFKDGRNQFVTGQTVDEADFVMKTEGTFPNVTHWVMPVLCNHCSDAACVKACPATPKAMYKTPEGVTLHDPARCLGCPLVTGRVPLQRGGTGRKKRQWRVLQRDQLQPKGSIHAAAVD